MKVHLIAIGGTGMGSVAGLLLDAGHEVRGSDEHLYPPMSDQLRALGVPVAEGFRPENLDWGPDRVVVGNVCRRDHVEVLAAQERGLTLTSFPALLEELFLGQRHSVVVAGTHGKTTTSSLMAHLLVATGRDPSFLIGGVPENFGRGWRLGRGPLFVIEGDEYDTAFFDKGSKFFHYRPRTAILTSVELDHVDIFASLDAVRAAFTRFVGLIPPDGLLVVAASSHDALAVAAKATCRVETYAVAGRAVDGVVPLWQAELEPALPSGRTAFTVTRAGEPVGRFELPLAGEHNVENALATVAAAMSLGLSAAELETAFPRFAGVKRRQELRGVARGVRVIDDYAHHPTALRETVAALRRQAGTGRLVAVFEPRSATSRRSTFQVGFAEALATADEVVVAGLFRPDGIPVEERLDPARLVADVCARGTHAALITEVPAIVEHVAALVRPGDTVAVFSSGGFEGIHEKLLFHLGDPVFPARREDMARVRALLAATGQTADDLTDERAPDVLVMRDGAGLTGCVALEIQDTVATLRALAVAPERRGRGLGEVLVGTAVGRARLRGVRQLFLVTCGAREFFGGKLGFQEIDPVAVAPAVASSPHFRGASGAAVAMRLDL